MEEDLDRISRGEKKWRQVLKAFYKPFEKNIDQVLEKAERTQVPVEKLNKPCPDCGKEEKGELVIRTGRFGKFISCSRFPECKHTDNFEEKIEGVDCPLCQKGQVVVKRTRRGASFYGCSTYPKCDWASWKEPKKGDVLSKEEWAEMQAARKARMEKRNKNKKSKAKPKKKK